MANLRRIACVASLIVFCSTFFVLLFHQTPPSFADRLSWSGRFFRGCCKCANVTSTKITPTPKEEIVEFGNYTELLPPFAPLRFPRCSSCAVVVPSGHLLNTSVGNRIDGHECVFRLNGSPTKGFERDVGKRTNFVFTVWSSRTTLKGLARLVEESKPLPRAVILRDRQLLQKSYEKKLISDCRSFERTACFTAGLENLLDVNRLFLTETGVNVTKMNMTLTTGFYAMAMVRKACKRTSIFGLSPENYCDRPKIKDVPYHYFEKSKVKECQTMKSRKSSRKIGHRFFLEKKLYRRWATIYNFTFYNPSWNISTQ